MANVDVIVIGAGPAGVVAALRAADLGARTALITHDEFGGMAANDGPVQPKFWLDVTTESLAGISNPPPVTVRHFLIGTENEKALICGFRFDRP
jgi:pyruvate/2-oxoglutarate dehydrogenase complex dihydrolipoamide dehydrogenase (E3) component